MEVKLWQGDVKWQDFDLIDTVLGCWKQINLNIQ